MEKKLENTISGEELIKKIEAETPQLQEEMNKFLDSFVDKYHCMTVAQVVCNTANMFSCGYDAGYMNGMLDLIEEIRHWLNDTPDITNIRKFLTEKECEITGIEEDEL